MVCGICGQENPAPNRYCEKCRSALPGELLPASDIQDTLNFMQPPPEVSTSKTNEAIVPTNAQDAVTHPAETGALPHETAARELVADPQNTSSGVARIESQCRSGLEDHEEAVPNGTDSIARFDEPAQQDALTWQSLLKNFRYEPPLIQTESTMKGDYEFGKKDTSDPPFDPPFFARKVESTHELESHSAPRATKEQSQCITFRGPQLAAQRSENWPVLPSRSGYPGGSTTMVHEEVEDRGALRLVLVMLFLMLAGFMLLVWRPRLWDPGRILVSIKRDFISLRSGWKTSASPGHTQPAATEHSVGVAQSNRNSNPLSQPVSANLVGEGRTAHEHHGASARELTQAEIVGKSENGQNQSTKVAWLRGATTKGDPDAPVRLANMYLTGEGVPRSCDQAITLLESAAAKRNVRARKKLASMYAVGVCVPRDPVQAYRWLVSALAADPTDQWARSNRDLIYQQMTPSERLNAEQHR